MSYYCGLCKSMVPSIGHGCASASMPDSIMGVTRRSYEALEKERDAFKAALEQIRDQDYRGNRCPCSQLAFKVLNKKD